MTFPSTMSPTALRPHGKRAALTIGAALLGLLQGCDTMPTAAPQVASQPALQTAAVAMPEGVDLPRIQRLDRGENTKIYVEMLRFADTGKAQFPAEMQSMVDFSPSGVTRLFTDTILLTRRFEVFDLRSTVVAKDTNYIIDAQVIEATQVLRPLEGGMRYANTQVTLSVQMKDVSTNVQMFPTAVLVDGRTGTTSGDRVTLGVRDDPNNPELKRALAADYHKALRRALGLAAARIESILRPLGRVVGVEGADIGVFGGSRNGLQGGDDLVIFRAQTTRLGEREVLSMTRPVALVKCSGVGTDTSQCSVTRKVAGYEAQPGDYAVITDESLNRVRKQ